jgi:hypothetical protein
MAHGQSVADELGKPRTSGIPWLVIVNKAGEKLITSDGPEGNVGYPFELHEIKHFLHMLKTTSPRMTGERLAAIETALNENAKKLGRREPAKSK